MPNGLSMSESVPNSILQTEHSFDQLMTLGGSRTSNPVDICQSNAYSSWFHKAARTCHLLGGSADKITIKESETFALNIYSLGNLIYNKRKPDSKISIRISSWLQVEGRSSVKVSHSVHGLEEKDSQYVLLEGPTYYFHASSKAGLTFAVRTAMCELMDHSDHPGSAQVVACEQFRSGSINISEAKPQKQRIELLSYEILSFTSQRKPVHPATECPFIELSVSRVQKKRVLDALLPENYLCSSADSISGLLGRHLPASQTSLSEVALVTDLHALEADNVIVQLHKHLLRDCVRQTEEVLSQRYAGSRPTAELIGILASIKFHNGWGVVCSAEPLSLQETLYTQEHPKENKLNRRSSVQSPKQYEMVLQGISKEQTLSPLGNCKHYKGEHPVVLSLVFPNEKECAILIQINATMRYRLGHSLDNPPPKTLVHEVDKVGQETIIMPVAHCVYTIDEIRAHRTVAKTLMAGAALASLASAKQLLALCSLRKTISNADQGKMTIGTINVTFTLKEVAQPTRADHFETTKSQTELGRKVTLQKERLLRESKKYVGRHNIGLTKEPQLAKWPIRVSQSEGSQELRVIHTIKEQLIAYLQTKEQLRVEIPECRHTFDSSAKQSGQKVKKIPSSLKVSRGSRVSTGWYRLVAQRGYTRGQLEWPRLGIAAHLLLSNNPTAAEFYFWRRCLLYEDISPERVLTELMQIKYDYFFLLNLISVSAVPSADGSGCVFPHLFYIRFQFWTLPRLCSDTMQVDTDTGEVHLASFCTRKEGSANLRNYSGKEADKIIHFSVSADRAIANHRHRFVQFVKYLHNGVLPIEIVDASTKFVHGVVYCPLRELIRRRRNEAVYLFDGEIRCRETVQGILKMELRALRKQLELPLPRDYLTQQKQLQTEQKQSQAEPFEARYKPSLQASRSDTTPQQSRIQKYKQRQSQQTSSKETHNNISQRQGGNCEKRESIERVRADKTMRETQTVHATRMNKQFVVLSQQNDRRYSVRYRILVKDDAQDSSSRGEIFIVKDVRSLDPADLAAVHMAYNSFDFVQLGSENEFELAAKSLCHFLLCYQAFPKPHDYPENSGNVENVGNVGNVGNAGNAENIKVRHNAERFVTITLQNDANGLVETVHRLKIVLLPDPGVCEFQLYRKADTKILLPLPLSLVAEKDSLLINDPTAVLRVGAVDSSGSCTHPSLEVTAPSMNHSKDVRLTLSKSNSSCPKLNLLFRVWGCQSNAVECQLFKTREVILTVPHFQLECVSTTVGSFYAVCENEHSLKFKGVYPLPREANNIFNNYTDTQTNLLFEVYSTTVGMSYHPIHLLCTATKRVLHRMIVSLQSTVLGISESFVLTIKPESLLQKILTEPFTFRNRHLKKMQFKLLTTDPRMVCPQSADWRMWIEAKQQKRVMLRFSVQQIVSYFCERGNSPMVILGVKCEKEVEYYSFRFHLHKSNTT